ncbi:MAG: ABC transporter permease [Mycoplasmataceae bacterium]|nr:ABC transporter permease [Mycoplasmataceae bacterium]
MFSPQMILLYATGLMASILAIIIFKNHNEDGSELIIASKPIIRRSLTFIKFLVLFVASTFVAFLLSLCGWLTLLYKDVTIYQAFSCFFSILLANLIMLMFMGAIALIIAAFLNKVWIILINVIIVTVATCFTITTTILIDTPSKESAKAGSAYTSYQYLTSDTKLHSAAFVYPFDTNILNDNDNDTNNLNIKFYDFDGQKEYWNQVEHQATSSIYRTFNVTNQFSLMNNGLALNDPLLTNADRYFCLSGNYAYSFDKKLLSTFNEKGINQNQNINEPNFFITFNHKVSSITDIEYPKTLPELITQLISNKELQSAFISWVINYLESEEICILGPFTKTSVASEIANGYGGSYDRKMNRIANIVSPNSSSSQSYDADYFKDVGDKNYQQTKGVGITDTQKEIFEIIYDKMFPDNAEDLKNYYLIDEPSNTGIPQTNDVDENNVENIGNEDVFNPSIQAYERSDSEQALSSGHSPAQKLGFEDPGTMKNTMDFFHLVLSGADLQECFDDGLAEAPSLHNPKFKDAFGIDEHRNDAYKANFCLAEAWLKFQYFLFNKITTDLNKLTNFNYRAAYNSQTAIISPNEKKVAQLSSSPFFPLATINNENNEGIYNLYKKQIDSIPPSYYGGILSLIGTAFPYVIDSWDESHPTDSPFGWPSNDLNNNGQLTYFNNQKALIYRAVLNFLETSWKTGWTWKNVDNCNPEQFNRDLNSYTANLQFQHLNWLAYENLSGSFTLQPYMSPTVLWIVWIGIDLLILSIAYIIYLKLDIK